MNDQSGASRSSPLLRLACGCTDAALDSLVVQRHGSRCHSAHGRTGSSGVGRCHQTLLTGHRDIQLVPALPDRRATTPVGGSPVGTRPDRTPSHILHCTRNQNNRKVTHGHAGPASQVNSNTAIVVFSRLTVTRRHVTLIWRDHLVRFLGGPWLIWSTSGRCPQTSSEP